MNRDTRYTIYVLALAALVMVATAGLTAAGSASTPDPADASLSNTDFEVVDQDDALTDEEKAALTDLVRESEALQQHFDGNDALQIDVRQSKTLADSELVAVADEYQVRISPPSDDQLPGATLSVDLDEQTLTIENTVAAVDDIEVNVEGDDRLTDEESDHLTELLLNDEDVGYQIQTGLGEPDAIDVTVVDHDGVEFGENFVAIEITADNAGETIHAAVDLDEETVQFKHLRMMVDVENDDEFTFTQRDVEATKISDVENDSEVEMIGSEEIEVTEIEIEDDENISEVGDEFTIDVIESGNESISGDDN